MKRNTFTNIKTLVLTSLVLILFTACFGEVTPKEWTSLIYPDKQNTKRSKKNGIYPTLEECRKASLLELSNLKLEEKGTYNCALNCTFHEGMKVEICEETTK